MEKETVTFIDKNQAKQPIIITMPEIIEKMETILDTSKKNVDSLGAKVDMLVSDPNQTSGADPGDPKPTDTYISHIDSLLKEFNYVNDRYAYIINRLDQILPS